MNLRNIFFASILTVFTVSVYAAPIDPARAINVAGQFMPAQHVASTPGKAQAPAQQTPEIVYTHYMPKSGRPAIYVINISGGFALVSADDVAHPVLGYNYGKPWPKDVDSLAPSVKGFLDDLAAQMEAASEHPQDAETAAEWQQPRKSPNRAPRRTPAESSLPDSVGPLLITTWDQGQYYNALCPEDQNALYGYDGHCPTGCIATAMAQIIKYWEYPTFGRGMHSYINEYYGTTLTVNYDSATYNFTDMPNALTSESTPEQVNAVAKLMYECGVAVNMQYCPTAGASADGWVRSGFVNYFRYNEGISYVKKAYLAEDIWDNMLRENISNRRPVFYCGGIHAFVCDGYKPDNYFHFNFGWSGDADGWFLTNAVNIGLSSFNSLQSILVDIYPDSTSNTVFGGVYSSQYVISDALKLLNYSGTNALTTPMTNGGIDETITFIPDDSTKQLVLDILKFDDTTDDETYAIYDGTTTDSLLRFLHFADFDAINRSPIVSTRNALTIVIYDANIDKNGASLRISKESPYRMVSNIEANTNDTSVILSWVENGVAMSWKVEYGQEGFVKGSGTVIIAENNSLTIPLQTPNETLEFRIQPICDTLDNNLINSIVINKKQYWTDVVTSQPEGFVITEDGMIHVTSAEGLAWVARMRNTPINGNNWGSNIDYSRHTISIEDDIDLSGYLWKPIIDWRGNFNGNGHVISNMRVMESIYEGGLFRSFIGDTIQDVGFVNSYVESAASTATIAAHLGELYKPSIAINCYSRNYVLSAKWPGGANGLFGCFSGSKIINCYASGKLLDGSSVGGLGGDGGYIRNCYTSVEMIENLHMRGLISGSSGNSSYINCFADIDYVKDTWSERYLGVLYDADNTEYSYFFGDPSNIGKVQNVAGFTRSGNTLAHTVPDTALNYMYEGSIDLVTALNQGVQEINSPLLREWVWDSISGLPVFSDFHVVTCPNVSNIIANNISYNQGCAVAVSWDENGSATEWQIKCLPSGITDEDSATYFISYSTTDTLVGLTLAKAYDIYVRPMCSSTDFMAWGTPFSLLVDKPYWVEMVTSCPNGYKEDANGNVIISSAEGLAWLSVCSNGLQGQDVHTYEGENIFIVNDLDMGRFKWTPISQFLNDGRGIQFMGALDGRGHSISNLYCNEKDSYTFYSGFLGFVGYAKESSVIKNITIIDGIFIGRDRIGALVGEGWGLIDNCHAQNVIIKGCSNVGGVVGHGAHIINSSSSGCIYSDDTAGGLVGFGGDIRNCYSTVNIKKYGIVSQYFKGGLVGVAGEVSNCYNTGDVELCFNTYGTIITGRSFGNVFTDELRNNIYTLKQDSIPFVANDNYGSALFVDTTSLDISGVLNKDIVIEGTSYSDLLSALNAWVDANNEDGKYRRWAADTENINGGFPIFYTTPKYEIIFKNEDGTILQTSTLEEGEMPVAPEVPAKASTARYTYTFAGWDHAIAPVTGNDTYIAVFTPQLRRYTITFLDDDGTMLESSVWDHGCLPSITTEPTKAATAQYTYTFAGWDRTIAMVTRDTSYTATYTATVNKYLITFANEDGTLIIAQEYEYGTMPVAPTAPTKETTAQYTYTFAGWDKEIVTVTTAATYTATFSATVNKYLITFANEDGTPIVAQEYDYGAMPVAPTAPTKDANAQYTYTFAGWDNEIVVVTGEAIYTATFTATVNKYLITFANEDGTMIVSQEYNYGAMPVAPTAPTKEATAQYTYTFAGWDNEIVAVTGAATYTATFSATVNKYLITFANEDGTPIVSQEYDYGVMPVAPTDPTKAATAQYTYTFAGWDKEIVAVTAAATYTATYSSTVNKYLITFVDEDGALLASNNVEYGTIPTAPDAPTKEATAQYTYTFAGWDSEIVAVTGAATYTAIYSSTVNRYIITFYDEDSLTVLCAEEYEYGAMPVCDEPEKPADEQYTYTFAGWTPEVVEVSGDAAYQATYTALYNPTALQNTTSAPQPMKLIEDEKIFILLPDGTRYSATGVKVE